MNRLAIALVVLCTVGGLANAGVVTYTIDFSDGYSGPFNVDQVLSLPMFDPGLGDLVSVSLDYQIAADGTIGYENTSGSAGNRTIRTFFTLGPDTYTTNGSLALSFGGAVLAGVGWDVSETYTFYVDVFDGTIDFAGPSGWSTVYLQQEADGSLFYDSDLSGFIGTGSLEFALAGQAESAISMPGGASQFRTLGAGSVSVTYAYVPEPATLALLGLGGLAIAIRRRRLA